MVLAYGRTFLVQKIYALEEKPSGKAVSLSPHLKVLGSIPSFCGGALHWSMNARAYLELISYSLPLLQVKDKTSGYFF